MPFHLILTMKLPFKTFNKTTPQKEKVDMAKGRTNFEEIINVKRKLRWFVVHFQRKF